MKASRYERCWLASLAVVAAVAGCSQPHRQPGTMYQVSTLEALMQGAYDGATTFTELHRHGDIGIGTLHGLDGEMILLGGRAWQAKSDGQVLPVPADWTTPFATVAFFAPQQQVNVAGPLDLAALAMALDSRLPTENIYYMARIDGRFAYVKTRSVPAQKPPYPPLLEASKQQSVFERRDVQGTLVAVRCPPSAQGTNLVGWHMHFLAGDHRFGGHVLALQMDGGTARITHLRQFEMLLPRKGRFVEPNLPPVSTQDIRKVEQ